MNSNWNSNAENFKLFVFAKITSVPHQFQSEFELRKFKIFPIRS